MLPTDTPINQQTEASYINKIPLSLRWSFQSDFKTLQVDEADFTLPAFLYLVHQVWRYLFQLWTSFRYSMQIWNIQSLAWFPVSPTQYVWQHSLLLEREAVVEWLLRHQKCHKRQSFPHCHSSIIHWSIQLSFYHADMLATPNQV